MLSFGVTILPDPPWQRLVELFQLAEQNGFDYGWTYDSHVLWQEPYPLLTLAAMKTERLKLGLNVTNPGTREPTVTASAFATLQDVSQGRMIIGIGRGDSARRTIGLQPVKVAEFEDVVQDDPRADERPADPLERHRHRAGVGEGPRPRSRCTSPATARGCSRSRAASPTA